MVRAISRKWILLVCVLVFSSQAVVAQVPQEKRSSGVMGPRKQMATIIFSGLGGAILGLSTLSFYGRPQDKLSNIAVGFALGIIIGTVYTTYNAATKPYIPDEPADPYSRLNIYETDSDIMSVAYKEKPSAPINTLGYGWSF